MRRDAEQAASGIEGALGSAFGKIGGLGKAVAGGLIAGGAVAALEGMRQAVDNSIKSVLELSDQAKRAGVSFKAFQELKFVAEQNRIDLDSLTDGLKELSLRADEFVKTGKGSSAEAFQRLGYDAATLAQKLKEPDQLFLEIIGKLQRLDKAAQIRVADEVFGGTGGEKFVQLISKGERGIRDQIKAANDLGNVMDEQMIAKAELVDQKFNMIASTIGTHLKTAIIDAVSAWSDFIDSYNEFKDQRDGTLEKRQAELGLKRLDIESQILAIGDSEPMTKRKLEVQLAEIAAEEKQIVEELNKRVKAVPAVMEPATQLDPIVVTGGSAKTGVSPYATARQFDGAQETSFEGLKLKQDQAAEASRFFAQTATDAITGLITGATTAEEALQTVLQSLVKVALQGALMGEGPLAGMFGTTEGVGLFSIFSKMLGFAEGGHVRGPGTGTSDSIIARLSNGEHVTNARSTAKYGPIRDCERLSASLYGGKAECARSRSEIGRSGAKRPGRLSLSHAGQFPEENAFGFRKSLLKNPSGSQARTVVAPSGAARPKAAQGGSRRRPSV